MRMLLLLLVLTSPAFAYDDPWFDNQMNERAAERRHQETLEALENLEPRNSDGGSAVYYYSTRPQQTGRDNIAIAKTICDPLPSNERMPCIVRALNALTAP